MNVYANAEFHLNRDEPVTSLSGVAVAGTLTPMLMMDTWLQVSVVGTSLSWHRELNKSGRCTSRRKKRVCTVMLIVFRAALCLFQLPIRKFSCSLDRRDHPIRTDLRDWTIIAFHYFLPIEQIFPNRNFKERIYTHRRRHFLATKRSPLSTVNLIGLN